MASGGDPVHGRCSRGVVRPDDPSLYTMRLNADGTVHMRLNCNRAKGTWTAEPGADPTNGGFRFGLLATTKALCPSPSLEEKIAADTKYVSGYMRARMPAGDY